MTSYQIEHYLTVDEQTGQRSTLLLCGGDKRTQNADIDRAVDYWQDWQRRNKDEKQRE